MRILIVYEKAGMGHLRMARILEDILSGEETEIAIKSGSEILGIGELNLTVNLWNYFMRRNWIKTADFVLNFAGRLLVLPWSDAFRLPRWNRGMESIHPDITICTCDMFGKAMGAYAVRHRIPLYIFITEIAIFLDLVNPHATHISYFDETAEAIRSYDFSRSYFKDKLDSASFSAKIGYVFRCMGDYLFKDSIYRNPDRPLPKLNGATCLAVGPLAERHHFVSLDAQEVQRFKSQCGISKGIDTVLVSSGSLGGQFVVDILKTIMNNYHNPLNLLVMCGNDEDSLHEVSHLENSNRQLNILPFGFTNDFEKFLEVADGVIIRPSAGIFIESILHRTPMIACEQTPSNDRGSLVMIRKYGLGEVFRRPGELVSMLTTVLADRKRYQHNIDVLLSGYPRSWEEKASLIRAVVLGHLPDHTTGKKAAV